MIDGRRITICFVVHAQLSLVPIPWYSHFTLCQFTAHYGGVTLRSAAQWDELIAGFGDVEDAHPRWHRSTYATEP